MRSKLQCIRRNVLSVSSLKSMAVIWTEFIHDLLAKIAMFRSMHFVLNAISKMYLILEFAIKASIYFPFH